MRIVIPGGSGQVGTFMARAFQRAGDEVIDDLFQSFEPTVVHVRW